MSGHAAEPSAIAAARALVAELVAQGVRDVVLAPGSRSAPLAYALAQAADDGGQLTLHVRVDERAAAFLALGLTHASTLPAGPPAAGPRAARSERAVETGTSASTHVPISSARSDHRGAARPVAVVTTSGTAVANLHPAVLEAHHTGVPLVLLTADRPHELRGSGASQTTDHVGIFGTAVRFVADVPAPDGRDGEVRDLLATAGRALAAALGLRDRNPGPVHLNLAYREPLHPTGPALPGAASSGAASAAVPPGTDTTPSAVGVSGEGRVPVLRVPDEPGGSDGAAQSVGVGPWPDGFRRTVVVPPAPGPGSDPALYGDPTRTLVVAGDGAGPAARELAEAQGWPLLAEPSSGACGGPNAVRAYRSLLGVDALSGEVEHVVVLGRPTLSRPVQRLLARPDVVVTVVAPGGAPWPDAARNAERVVDALAERWFTPTSRERTFLDRWLAASQAAADVVVAATTPGDSPDDDGSGPDAATALRATRFDAAPFAALSVARAVSAATGPDEVLVVGSSNPVRDLDLVLGLDGEPGTVLANRGLAGIDGTVSTAYGVALAAARQGRRTRALLGDLTFLHDVGGLLRGPLEPAAALQLVVVNDDGGSIFATLEHGELAAASEAGSRTFERVFGTPHGVDLGPLCAAYGVGHRAVDDAAGLRAALAAPAAGTEVVEVRVPRRDRLVEARALHQAIVAAARAALVVTHGAPAQ